MGLPGFLIVWLPVLVALSPSLTVKSGLHCLSILLVFGGRGSPFLHCCSCFITRMVNKAENVSLGYCLSLTGVLP